MSTCMHEVCTKCNCDLEEGQIGLCDFCQESTTWTNHYLCPCGCEWDDTHDCCCNDRCPNCNKEIEPYISDDGSLESEQIEAAREKAANRMGIVLEN